MAEGPLHLRRDTMRNAILTAAAGMILSAPAFGQGKYSCLWYPAVHADDKEIDQSIGTIHKIDLADETPKGPNYILVVMDLKRLKVPGARGHSIVRQFTKRSRIDFDGSGLPKGKYTLAVADDCKSGTLPAAKYKSALTELHQFQVISTHIATEKSLPKAALREPSKGLLVLENKSLHLFRVQKDKFETIDCKPITG